MHNPAPGKVRNAAVRPKPHTAYSRTMTSDDHGSIDVSQGVDGLAPGRRAHLPDTTG
jgi:hypothetical protein